jgi:hypothetical protein
MGVRDAADIDAMVADAARGYADRLRSDIKAPAEADRLRAELDADVRRFELATLRYRVKAPRLRAEKLAMLNDPAGMARAEAARLALEVKRPEVLAAAARYREERQRERRQAAVDSIVASALAYPHGRNGSGVADRLRRMAANGSTFAGDILAEVHARQSQRLNRAIIASGGPRSDWTVATVGDHVRGGV